MMNESSDGHQPNGEEESMNFKSMTIIALALCLCVAIVVPVSAESMWSNGNWVPSNYYDGYTVQHDKTTGVDSKYNPNVGSKYDISQDPNTYSGRIEVIVKVHSNTMNPFMYIANNITPNITKTIAVNHDGVNTIPDLPDGEFIVTLDRYDLPDETQHVIVRAGQQGPSRVVFEGQGVSSVPELYPMTIQTNIDGCNVHLNGLKLVKDELITVPESTKQVCKRVKVIDQPYVPAVPGTPEQGHWITVVDVPAQPAVPAQTHQDYEAGHVHAKRVSGNSQHDFHYYGDKYQIVGSSHEDAFIVNGRDSARRANMVTITDVPAKPAVPAVTHQEWVVDVPAVPAVPAIPERSHYETQCHDVVVPSYQYWTYKLEGRLTVKSIDTEITNPNRIPLSGTATVVVGYTVDHNFGHLLNTNQDLENVRKTFTGRFENVAPGVNDYGDVQIVFSDRINDAIIVDDYFPSVIESSIVTDVPFGYHMNN